MEAKIKENRIVRKELWKGIKDESKKPSDSELKSTMNELHKSQVKELEIKKEYAHKFGDLLGYERAFKLGAAEKEFRKGLMERMKRSNPGKKGDPGKPNRRNLIEKN
jgi:hypothetical protein